MKKMYTYIVAALLIVACSLWFYHANAKVCFLPDGECGDSRNETPVPPEDDGSETCCNPNGSLIDPRYWNYVGLGEWKLGDAGKCVTKRQCDIDGWKSISTCPANNKYTHCCPPEFVLTECPAPSTIKSECGRYVTCKCSESKYKYYRNDGGQCTDGTHIYENATIYNDSCSVKNYDEEEEDWETVTRYAKCTCDSELYPSDIIPEDCTTYETCTASDGSHHYRCTATCNYTKTQSNCQGGMLCGNRCTLGEITFYETCRMDSCGDRTVYENKNSVQHADTWGECHSDCDTVKYYPTKCENGYALSNGTCIQKSCKLAIENYWKYKNGNESTENSTYVLYTGAAISSSDSEKTVIVPANVSVYTHLEHFANKKVISGTLYGELVYNVPNLPNTEKSLISDIKEQCEVPQLTFSGNVSNSGSSDQNFHFAGIKLRQSDGSFNVYGGKFKCTNCSIDLKFLNFYNTDVYLNYSTTEKDLNNSVVYDINPTGWSGVGSWYVFNTNSDNVYVKGKIQLKLDSTTKTSTFRSLGYNYDLTGFLILNNPRNRKNIISIEGSTRRVGAPYTSDEWEKKNFKTDELYVIGAIAFKDIVIESKLTNIGGAKGIKTATCQNGMSNYQGYCPSQPLNSITDLGARCSRAGNFMTLYRSDFNLRDTDKLYICTASVIGQPNRNEAGNWYGLANTYSSINSRYASSSAKRYCAIINKDKRRSASNVPTDLFWINYLGGNNPVAEIVPNGVFYFTDYTHARDNNNEEGAKWTCSNMNRTDCPDSTGYKDTVYSYDITQNNLVKVLSCRTNSNSCDNTPFIESTTDTCYSY